jgi:glycosyltransferase involved in cell wall biosynthesis
MKVVLFRAFPDSFRKSMQIYADQLLNRIRPLLQSEEQLEDCLPAKIHLNGNSRYWDQYVRYQWLSRTAQGDVNHVIDHGYGHLLHSLCKEKSIVTFHDSVVNKLDEISWRTRLSVRYSFLALRKAARIITDSKLSRNDFLNLVHFPDEKVQVIYPGVDAAFRVLPDRAELRERYNLPHSFILHVGNNLPYMNVDCVLLTLEHLVKKGLDISLIRVGDFLTKKQEAFVNQANLSTRVIQLGTIQLEKLVVIYNCAALLVYVPLYAGFGLPPLEAMACGTPVICSNRGSLPEITGDAGFMIDPENHLLVAEAAIRLLADRELQEMYRARGFKQARLYSWDKTAAEVLSVYRSVHQEN